MVKDFDIIRTKQTLILIISAFFTFCVAIGLTPSTAMAGDTAPQKRLNVTDTIKELQKLAQHEIDYSFVLSQGIENVKDEILEEKLLSFKKDTEQRIEKLSGLIRKLGGNPPAYSRDFRGFVMQGYTAVRGLTSDTGIIKALYTNNKIILNAYKEAKKFSYEAAKQFLSMPPSPPSTENLKSIIEDFYQEQKKTYEYLMDRIR